MNAPGALSDVVNGEATEQKPVVPKAISVRADAVQLALLMAAFEKADSISGANLTALSEETKL
jgi:hypothetical protein